MKLTKKAALAANEDIQAKIGFKPELDTTLKVGDLYKELYQKILDVEIDDDDREDLEDSTCEVIDALAEMFPDMSGDAQEEQEEEEQEEQEEKPAKKEKKEKKGKKAKKEEPEPEEEEEEEKPAKKAKGKKAKAEKEEPVKKSKKAKKGAIDPAELAEQIKTDKKINRDGLFEIINANPELFGDNVETLLSITNPMVLKKQMRNVLEGGKVEMTKTKKPAKKEKVVEPTLTEKVNAIEDLDELKALAKANKDSFPGVKAKKFDKLKKLRKALLEVVVEAKGKKKGKTSGKNLDTVREERQKRIDWITNYINENGGKVGRKKLTAKALEAFPNPAKSVRDIISYGKNPKYNKFEKLLVEVDGVIGWEGELDTTPKKSKGKTKIKGGKTKEVVVEKPAKKEKKEKKNKKGKKGKK